jgi:ribosomal 30S subunit maturation factor RimM
MSSTWHPTTHADYDTLKGFDVYSSDDEKLGTIKEVLHPQTTGRMVTGGHYFRVDPGALKKLFSDQDEVFVAETMIRRVDAAEDKVVLEVTKDRIQHETWSQPADFDTYRRT